MPARLPAIALSVAPSAASSAFSVSRAAAFSAATWAAVLLERSSTSMTFVALPVLPAVALTVTRALTAPPHAIALGDPLANACEPVADGLTAAGATPRRCRHEDGRSERS